MAGLQHPFGLLGNQTLPLGGMVSMPGGLLMVPNNPSALVPAHAPISHVEPHIAMQYMAALQQADASGMVHAVHEHAAQSRGAGILDAYAALPDQLQVPDATSAMGHDDLAGAGDKHLSAAGMLRHGVYQPNVFGMALPYQPQLQPNTVPLPGAGPPMHTFQDAQPAMAALDVHALNEAAALAASLIVHDPAAAAAMAPVNGAIVPMSAPLQDAALPAAPAPPIEAVLVPPLGGAIRPLLPAPPALTLGRGRGVSSAASGIKSERSSKRVKRTADEDTSHLGGSPAADPAPVIVMQGALPPRAKIPRSTRCAWPSEQRVQCPYCHSECLRKHLKRHVLRCDKNTFGSAALSMLDGNVEAVVGPTVHIPMLPFIPAPELTPPLRPRAPMPSSNPSSPDGSDADRDESDVDDRDVRLGDQEAEQAAGAYASLAQDGGAAAAQAAVGQQGQGEAGADAEGAGAPRALMEAMAMDQLVAHQQAMAVQQAAALAAAHQQMLLQMAAGQELVAAAAAAAVVAVAAQQHQLASDGSAIAGTGAVHQHQHAHLQQQQQAQDMTGVMGAEGQYAVPGSEADVLQQHQQQAQYLQIQEQLQAAAAAAAATAAQQQAVYAAAVQQQQQYGSDDGMSQQQPSSGLLDPQQLLHAGAGGHQLGSQDAEAVAAAAAAAYMAAYQAELAQQHMHHLQQAQQQQLEAQGLGVVGAVDAAQYDPSVHAQPGVGPGPDQQQQQAQQGMPMQVEVGGLQHVQQVPEQVQQQQVPEHVQQQQMPEHVQQQQVPEQMQQHDTGAHAQAQLLAGLPAGDGVPFTQGDDGGMAGAVDQPQDQQQQEQDTLGEVTDPGSLLEGWS